MTIDRYSKIILTVIALALSIIAGKAIIPAIPQAEAQSLKLAVPKAFGKLAGFTVGHLLFEAADGTLRAVNAADQGRVEILVQRN